MSYSYDAWGNTTVTEHGNVNEWLHLSPFGYRGYIYVKGFDMYYLGSRWYDPAVGRFISPASVISGANGSLQGFNLYAYCFNNPVNMTDETGHWPEWMEKAAKGICNAAEWVSNNIVEPVVEAVTSTDWTYSIGLTGTLSAGPVAVMYKVD